MVRIPSTEDVPVPPAIEPAVSYSEDVRRRSAASRCLMLRKSRMSSTAGVGFSSMIQWPASGTTAPVTSTATLRMEVAINAPKDLSPPIASTGMVSFVRCVVTNNGGVVVAEVRHFRAKIGRLRPLVVAILWMRGAAHAAEIGNDDRV